MRLFSFAVAFSLLGAAACGSNVTGAGGGGAAVNHCPVIEPTAGSSCSEPNRHCTYGTSPRAECRDLWICSGSAWMKTGNTGKSSCIEPPPGVCSGLPASPDGVVCPQEGDVCVQGTATICVCTACSGGPCMVPPPKWTCAGPPSTPECPPILPNQGTACSTAGLTCTYGKPCSGSGAILECLDGAWVQQDVACPV